MNVPAIIALPLLVLLCKIRKECKIIIYLFIYLFRLAAREGQSLSLLDVSL